MPSDKTRDALLDAAIDCFARTGFKRATVRMICEQADVNLASVNYHFGSKQALYDAALDRARSKSNAMNRFVQMDVNRDFHADKPAQERLWLMVRTSLEHTFYEGKLTPLVELMAEEMRHPTPALERQVELSVRRVNEALADIMQQLLPKSASRDDAHFFVRQTSAMIYNNAFAHPMIELLYPDMTFDAQSLDTLAYRITELVLSGIERFQSKAKSGSRSTKLKVSKLKPQK